MKTILVVDDNKLNLASARQVLEHDYRVIPVMKGQQALAYLENGECDMILLDINMPEMDGFEVLERIRDVGRGRSIPVIFLTADNDPNIETLCFKRGAVDFIGKPFVPDVMLSRIGRALELEELRRNLAERLEQKTREVTAIRKQARQDALTSLWNRSYTEERVNQFLEEGTVGALMMVDVDNFKRVNDTYGHIAGDRLLQMLAGILRKAFSVEDVLCRIGGDEFVAFVKDVTAKDVLSSRAQDIITEFCQQIGESGWDVPVSISIGIALPPEDGCDFLSLYGSADKALYYVKQNGKNAYHFFSDKLQEESGSDGRTVDLQYLQDLMSRADSGMGAYQLDFENFNHVYNFISRFVERSNRDVQTVLFTISESGNTPLEATEAEFALEMLERAIYTSLRRSDVSTRYSSKQLIVILMDASSENSDMVAERIIEHFRKLYTNGQVCIDYGIARLDNRGSESKKG